MQVEIINPLGCVSYRRPHDHPMIREALRTPGYTVHLPGVGMTWLDKIECVDGLAYTVVIGRDGLRITTPDWYRSPQEATTRKGKRE